MISVLPDFKKTVSENENFYYANKIHIAPKNVQFITLILENPANISST